MIMTYDDEANASYLYFTPIDPGGVHETITNQRMEIGLDDNDQILTLKVYESEKCQFRNRLTYALQHPEARYDETGTRLIITFAETGKEKKAVTWDANLDMDKSGQILGVEVLYADPGYEVDEGQEKLHAEGKLDHISKYIVPFDELH